MRPGDFSPGNIIDHPFSTFHRRASMRPGDFSPGNEPIKTFAEAEAEAASMRPGDFSPGNPVTGDREEGSDVP